MKKLTKKQQTDLISYTNQFDAVWDAVVGIYEMGGGAFDPSLLSSYNGNTHFAFTLSNRVFKGGY